MKIRREARWRNQSYLFSALSDRQLFSQKSFIIDVRLGSKYTSGVPLNMIDLFKKNFKNRTVLLVY